MPGVVARNESHGVEWQVELERDDLLPGRLARGTVRMVTHGEVDARAVICALIATERWQHQETTTGPNGTSPTRTVTSTHELQRLPVELLGPTHLGAGETRELPFEAPVPPLGPASLDATVSRLDWELEAKIDSPGWFDSSISVPVRVLQPIALLRAGVVHVGAFALYPAADAEAGGARASVELEPMPLCAGAQFTGRLTVESDHPMGLQEVRLELRVKVEATVASGCDEEITAWVGHLPAVQELSGSQVYEFRDVLPPRDLPTIELPHGTANAAFHVILARAMAHDPHLVRDVAICSTTEI